MRRRRVEPDPPELMFQGRRYATEAERQAAVDARAERRRRILARIESERRDGRLG